jgi:hypothetical protein
MQKMKLLESIAWKLPPYFAIFTPNNIPHLNNLAE